MVMATAVLDQFAHNVNNHIAKKKPNLLGSLQHHGLIDPKQLIGEALHRRVEAIDHEICDAGEEDTFYVADLGEVYRQHLRWKKNLPRIKPFYGQFSPVVCVSQIM
jgi:ornithine decarboxylase